MIEPYLDLHPSIEPTAWVHPSAQVIGDVHLHERVSIWPTAVLRGDQGRIEMGADSNLQDGAVVHCTGGISVTHVGQRVTIGHRAIIHGCRIEDDCLIGMGAIVMDNAIIGRGSLVGAGSIVLAGTEIPPGSLVLGTPGKATRAITDQQRAWIEHSWDVYARLAREHATGKPATQGSHQG